MVDIYHSNNAGFIGQSRFLKSVKFNELRFWKFLLLLDIFKKLYYCWRRKKNEKNVSQEIACVSVESW